MTVRSTHRLSPYVIASVRLRPELADQPDHQRTAPSWLSVPAPFHRTYVESTADRCLLVEPTDGDNWTCSRTNRRSQLSSQFRTSTTLERLRLHCHDADIRFDGYRYGVTSIGSETCSKELLWYRDVLGGEEGYNTVVIEARGEELGWKRGGWCWWKGL